MVREIPKELNKLDLDIFEEIFEYKFEEHLAEKYCRWTSPFDTPSYFVLRGFSSNIYYAIDVVKKVLKSKEWEFTFFRTSVPGLYTAKYRYTGNNSNYMGYYTQRSATHPALAICLASLNAHGWRKWIERK